MRLSPIQYSLEQNWVRFGNQYILIGHQNQKYRSKPIEVLDSEGLGLFFLEAYFIEYFLNEN